MTRRGNFDPVAEDAPEVVERWEEMNWERWDMGTREFGRGRSWTFGRETIPVQGRKVGLVGTVGGNQMLHWEGTDFPWEGVDLERVEVELEDALAER